MNNGYFDFKQPETVRDVQPEPANEAETKKEVPSAEERPADHPEAKAAPTPGQAPAPSAYFAAPGNTYAPAPSAYFAVPGNAYAPAPLYADTSRSNGFALASLFLGIASLVFCFTMLLPLVTAPLAMVFFPMDYARNRRVSPLAVVGLVTALIGFFLAIIILVFVAAESAAVATAFVAAAGSEPGILTAASCLPF